MDEDPRRPRRRLRPGAVSAGTTYAARHGPEAMGRPGTRRGGRSIGRPTRPARPPTALSMDFQIPRERRPAHEGLPDLLRPADRTDTDSGPLPQSGRGERQSSELDDSIAGAELVLSHLGRHRPAPWLSGPARREQARCYRRPSRRAGSAAARGWAAPITNHPTGVGSRGLRAHPRPGDRRARTHRRARPDRPGLPVDLSGSDRRRRPGCNRPVPAHDRG